MIVSYLQDLFVPFHNPFYSLVVDRYNSLTAGSDLYDVILFWFEILKRVLTGFARTEWFPFFAHLPTIIPKAQQAVLNETFALSNSPLDFFAFLPESSNPFLKTHLILGFCNGLFLILPLTIGHLLTIRRFLLYGPRPGLASFCGTLIGQLTFIISVLFGLRFLVIPWVSLSWLHFFLLINLFRRFHCEQTSRLFNLKNQEEPSVLIGVFFDNLVLAWTEQTYLFQYLHHLSFGRQPTVLESFSSPDGLSWGVQNVGYLIGVTLGSLFFTVVFGSFLNWFRDFLFSVGTFSYARVFKSIHFVSALLINVFFLTSNPLLHYGPELLITNSLPLTAADRTLQTSYKISSLHLQRFRPNKSNFSVTFVGFLKDGNEEEGSFPVPSNLSLEKEGESGLRRRNLSHPNIAVERRVERPSVNRKVRKAKEEFERNLKRKDCKNYRLTKNKKLKKLIFRFFKMFDFSLLV